MAWSFRFAILRLKARWRSLVTLIIGVFLAALIGANASLYTSAISQVGMVQFLTRQASDEINLYSRTSLSPSGTDNFALSWAELDTMFLTAFNDTLGNYHDWTGNLIGFAETQDFFPMFNGEDISDIKVRLAYYDNLENFVELVEGTWPSDSNDADVPLEIALQASLAAQMGLKVGDILQFDQRGWDTSRVFSARISGLLRPIDANSSYWFEPSPFRLDARGTSIQTNFFITRAAMETIPAEFIPEPAIQIGWRVAPDFGKLPYSRTGELLVALDDFEGQLNRAFLADESAKNRLVYNTNLPDLFSEYNEQIVFLNIPFGLLTLNLVALVLFFLVLITALVRRGERREIAMLQSRGATDRQIIWTRSIEAFIICLSATVITPFIAQYLLQWFIPVFTGIKQLPLELNSQVFLFSGIASLCAFILLLLTLFPVLRQPLISAGGLALRSEKQSWWQRYYLDVVLLILGMAALYQLNLSQSFIAESGSGYTQVDPLLLLTPTLLFVALSGVLLRFFPALMTAIAGFYTRRRSLEAVLASWQVSREPLHYGRIAFLLALAIGIGWFAISYQATLVGNQHDQAAYFVGADVRVVYQDAANPETLASMKRIAQLDEVSQSGQVARIHLPSIVSGGQRRSRQAGTILAVDSNSLNHMITWRSDLGELPDTSESIDIPDTVGQPIPTGTEHIAFSARIDARQQIGFGLYTEDARPYPLALLDNATLTITVHDEAGAYYELQMQPNRDAYDAFIEELFASDTREGVTQSLLPAIDTDGDGQPDDLPPIDWPDDGWVYFEADLSQLYPTPQGTLNFVSLDFFMPNEQIIAGPQLRIGDVQAIDAENNKMFMDWYDTGTWNIVGSLNSQSPTTYTIETLDDEHGQSALLTDWYAGLGFNSPSSSFSLLLDYPELTSVTVGRQMPTEENPTGEYTEEGVVGLPVVVSQSFLKFNEFEVGQRFSLNVSNLGMWFEAAEINDYYPTLYQDLPYIIVDHEALNYVLQRASGSRINANELWIRLESGTDESAFIANLKASEDTPLFKDILGMEATLGTYQTDIFAIGVIGLLLISFGVGLVLSVVSLFTYISLTVQSRIGEFAVLRALGMTTTRLTLSIMIEQLLVLIAAIVLGIIIGQFMTVLILPPLALSAAGTAVTPPYIIRLDYFAMLQYLLTITVVLVIVLLMSAVWVRRTATAEALRLSEE